MHEGSDYLVPVSLGGTSDVVALSHGNTKAEHLAVLINDAIGATVVQRCAYPALVVTSPNAGAAIPLLGATRRSAISSIVLRPRQAYRTAVDLGFRTRGTSAATPAGPTDAKPFENQSGTFLTGPASRPDLPVRLPGP
ncbi:hypothetical protein [Nocardia sp. NRRL S-836]|uniref:hypothetical protein n=1 Tax=Nocardia sp. NRRL S-836 TaxID=1519492 RepID=UPI0012FBFEDF|nr:hypothetical protein [Nocardia sp. NRRL S-836]